jgi:hypothetical protein
MNVNNCYTEGHIKTNNKLSVERGKSNLGIVVVVVVELTVVKVSGYLYIVCKGHPSQYYFC